MHKSSHAERIVLVLSCLPSAPWLAAIEELAQIEFELTGVARSGQPLGRIA